MAYEALLVQAERVFQIARKSPVEESQRALRELMTGSSRGVSVLQRVVVSNGTGPLDERQEYAKLEYCSN